MTHMLTKLGRVAGELIAVAVFVGEGKASVGATQTTLCGCFAGRIGLARGLRVRALTGTIFVRMTGSGSTEVVPLTGTYTVNPDCTVSDTFGNSQHESVIVDGGRGYVILNTTEGAPVVISGEARKQFSEDSQ